MQTYTVTLRSATRWTDRTIQAKTPAAALNTARKTLDADPLSFDWEHYDSDGTELLEEIVVSDERGAELATWISDDCLRRHAAEDMLAALEQAIQALNAAPRFPVPHLLTDSYRIAAICSRAIAKAKGGAR